MVHMGGFREDLKVPAGPRMNDDRNARHGLKRGAESAPCCSRSFGHDARLAQVFRKQGYDTARLAVIDGPEDDGFGMKDAGCGHYAAEMGVRYSGRLLLAEACVNEAHQQGCHLLRRGSVSRAVRLFYQSVLLGNEPYC